MCVAHAVVFVSSQVPVLLCNLASYPVSLRKGMRLGTAQHVIEPTPEATGRATVVLEVAEKSAAESNTENQQTTLQKAYDQIIPKLLKPQVLEVQKLLREFIDIFYSGSTDLGKTALT